MKKVLSQIWKIANMVRGHIDIEEFKEPFLSLVFLKYLNDIQLSVTNKFICNIPKEATWSNLFEDTNSEELAGKLNRALYALERANPILDGALSGTDFNKIFHIDRSQDVLPELLYSLSEIDFVNGDFKIAEFFDASLFYFDHLSGKKGGISIQPKELTTLMMSFMPALENISIYNPFAGYASLAINLPKRARYYGQELNRKTWAIAKLRLLVYGIGENVELECENSVSEWRDRTTDFDQS